MSILHVKCGVCMKIKFIVTGMTCAACSARVEKVTRQVEGVEKADVNLLAGTMVVEAESDAVVGPICEAVEKAGYHAALPEDSSAPKKKEEKTPQEDALKEMKVRIVGSAISLVILMYFTMRFINCKYAPFCAILSFWIL